MRKKSMGGAMLRLDKFMGGDGFESPTRCVKGLYVGGQGEARDLGLLRSLGVTHIVNSAIQNTSTVAANIINITCSGIV